MTVSFHLHALKLLHLKHHVDPLQMEWMDDWERHTGFKLPAAFREWYGMTHHGFPINWDPEPESYALRVPWDDPYWPLMLHQGQWYLTVLGWNLDGQRAYMPLDGRDDPPVYLKVHWDDMEFDAHSPMELHAATFSQYIFGWLMEAHHGLLKWETAHPPLPVLGEQPLQRLQEVITFLQQRYTLASRTHAIRNWLRMVSVWHFLGEGEWVQIQHFDDDTTFTVTGGALKNPAGVWHQMSHKPFISSTGPTLAWFQKGASAA